MIVTSKEIIKSEVNKALEEIYFKHKCVPEEVLKKWMEESIEYYLIHMSHE